MGKDWQQANWGLDILERMLGTLRNKWWLPLAVLAVSAAVILVSGVEQIPILFPLWALMVYALWPFNNMEEPALWSMLGILALITLGMAFGPLQSSDLANHLSHLVVAVMLALIALVELNHRAAPLVVALAVMGVVGCCGIGLELAEAGAHWNDVDGRYHDTIMDLSTDLVGGLLGLLIGWRLIEAGWIGQNTLPETVEDDHDRDQPQP